MCLLASSGVWVQRVTLSQKNNKVSTAATVAAAPAVRGTCSLPTAYQSCVDSCLNPSNGTRRSVFPIFESFRLELIHPTAATYCTKQSYS